MFLEQMIESKQIPSKTEFDAIIERVSMVNFDGKVSVKFLFKCTQGEYIGSSVNFTLYLDHPTELVLKESLKSYNLLRQLDNEKITLQITTENLAKSESLWIKAFMNKECSVSFVRESFKTKEGQDKTAFKLHDLKKKGSIPF